jgi:hypothetical protein
MAGLPYALTDFSFLWISRLDSSSALRTISRADMALERGEGRATRDSPLVVVRQTHREQV